MKVLQINSVCGVGSTGRIATDIHNVLIEQGHESYIAYGREMPSNCNNSVKIGSIFDNYLHVAVTRAFDKHGFGSKKSTRIFIDEIKKINPDIIHLHNLHGYYLNISVLFEFLKEANKPVIWTLHDCWSFTGHCAYFDYVGCDRWKTGCHNCPEKKSYPKSLLIDNSESNYLSKREIFTNVQNLTIVTPSKWLKELVNKSYLKDYPVKVIHNGIDTKIFKPSASNFRTKYKIGNKFVILGVANVWDRRKGLNYFLDLANLVDENYKIVIIGVSEVQKKNLPENIIGISRTNNITELAQWYTLANVFVNPTLEDNYPTTNLESISCGTPVVTFNTGGSIESARYFGKVTKEKNAHALLEKILEVKDDHEYKKITSLSSDTTIMNYVELYKTVREGGYYANSIDN